MGGRGVALLAGAAVVLVACRGGGAVFDGFESPTLGSQWGTKRFLPGAVEIQSSVVRAGARAAKITLRSGDQIPQEKGTVLERAELEESRGAWSREESASAYSFSMFLPRDFPIVPTRLVIAQWKHRCPVEHCTPDNPMLAIRYQGGEMLITKQVTSQSEVLYRTTEDIRNKWLDFRFEIRFSREQGGRVKAWLGGRQIVDHKGATAYPGAGGYTGRGWFYFKLGLYRDRMPEPMTIYLDEYRKQPMPAGIR